MDRPSTPSTRWEAFGAVGVLLLALVVFAIPAGRRPFWSSDEARFAVLAQDILDHGRWFVPHIRGDLYLNKPQLYFWSIAAVSLPAGRVTELTAAIPSVASAVAAVAGVLATGQLLWGPRVGLLAALILIATPPFYAFSHAVLSDVMMTAFMTWALYFLVRASVSGGGTRLLLAFYGCVGAAVLAKGPAGLAALAAGIVATGVTGGPRALTRLKPVHGLGILVAVALVWFTPYLVQSRGRFVSQVLVGHYTPWYLGGGMGPRLGQFTSLLGNFLPWTVLVAPAVVWWARHPDARRRWIGVATLSLALVLGLSGHQRARYLLPIYPGLALLTAEFVGRAGAEGSAGALRLGAWLFAVLATTGAVVGPFVQRYVVGEDRVYLPGSSIELAVIVALALGAALSQIIAAQRGAFATGTAVAAVLVAGVMILEGATYPRRYTPANDLRPLAEAVRRHTPAGSAVVAYPDARLSLDFYVRRPVVEAVTPEKAAALVSRGPGAVFTTRTHWPALAALLPASFHVVATAPAGGREYLVLVP